MLSEDCDGAGALAPKPPKPPKDGVCCCPPKLNVPVLFSAAGAGAGAPKLAAKGFGIGAFMLEPSDDLAPPPRRDLGALILETPG